MFGSTAVMQAQDTNSEIGRYLILRLSFAGVSIDGNVRENFRDYINRSCKLFSEKYHGGGQLMRPVDVNARNALDTLQDTFGIAQLSGRQIYLIVDDCDRFTSKPVLGHMESMLHSWGEVVKEGTVGGKVARAFFTGVPPQFLANGLSSLSMVKDLTFAPKMQGLFGLAEADVKRGLEAVDTLSEAERRRCLEMMCEQYGGYRFVDTQKDSLYNTQNVLYFLYHLEQYGYPPAKDPVAIRSMHSDCVSGTMPLERSYGNDAAASASSGESAAPLLVPPAPFCQ